MYPVFSNPLPIALFLSNINGVGGGGGCFISNEKNIVKGKTSPPPIPHHKQDWSLNFLWQPCILYCRNKYEWNTGIIPQGRTKPQCRSMPSSDINWKTVILTKSTKPSNTLTKRTHLQFQFEYLCLLIAWKKCHADIWTGFKAYEL